MSRLKPAEYKKQFLRNTEQPLPKTLITFGYEQKKKLNPGKISTGINKANLDHREIQKNETGPETDNNYFSSLKFKQNKSNGAGPSNGTKTVHILHPKFHKTNTLDLEKKSNVPKHFNEKTLKCLNFPHDKAIYKGLIPLSGEQLGHKSKPPTREPHPRKDKEPQLSDFFKSQPHHEYVYHVPVQKQESSIYQTYDGHRLYKLMLNWQ